MPTKTNSRVTSTRPPKAKAAGVVMAVFPGTFDPITLGHEDLIARSALMFDRVVVGVAAGHHKKTMFALDERLAMVREVTVKLGNVSAVPMDGLMCEFVQQQAGRSHVPVVVRGVRNGSDFDYEFQLAGMNRERMGSLETIFLMPSVSLQFISSTRVREIAALGGEVHRFVSAPVHKRIVAKLNKLNKIQEA